MNWIIIVAGGNGSRMGQNQNKVFLPINGKEIIAHTLEIFESSEIIDHILITAKQKDIDQISSIVTKYDYKKIKKIVTVNSKERQKNTWEAIKWLLKNTDSKDIVGIHNAVNPLVSAQEIEAVFTEAKKHGAALLAMPAKDTVKVANKNLFVDYSPNREQVFYAQTPQVAKLSILKKAFQKAESDNFWGTDDTSLIERINEKVKLVYCSANNIKITYPIDLVAAQQMILQREINKAKHNE